MLILAGPVGADTHRVAGHPEAPERVRAAVAGVERLHLGDDLVVVDAREATCEEMGRVHDDVYLESLARLSAAGGGRLDPDTFVTEDTWSTAKLAAGTGLAAVEALARGEGDVAFVVARPPGHHAGRARAMGFCLVNHIAVVAAALAATGERVMIVDWDVHHGNGTQDLFWDDARVLYASTHQYPLYPGTGAVDETGGPSATGLNVNVPLPPGATGDVVEAAFEDVLAPAAERFAPTWVLVSAGYDAHRADPLAQLDLSSGDFARMAAGVARFAPRPGRTALFLEGGYDLAALADSVQATIGALVGEGHAPEAPTSGGPGRESVERAARVTRVA